MQLRTVVLPASPYKSAIIKQPSHDGNIMQTIRKMHSVSDVSFLPNIQETHNLGDVGSISTTREQMLGDMGVRVGERLIYDFEKLGTHCCGIGAGIHPQVKREVPIELSSKGITGEEWYHWMSELNEIQILSPSEGGMRIMFCFPGLCVQALLCSIFCPVSMNHCLSWLPCCYGDWYDELREWMRTVNKTLNTHGMHAKILTYKPYTSAPNSKLYQLRVSSRPRDNRYTYEMTFLVIALTPNESKILKYESWDHGVNDCTTAGIGRCA